MSDYMDRAVEAAAEAQWNRREYRDPTGDVPDDWCPPGHDVHQPAPREPDLWAPLAAAGKYPGSLREAREDACACIQAAEQNGLAEHWKAVGRAEALEEVREKLLTRAYTAGGQAARRHRLGIRHNENGRETRDGNKALPDGLCSADMVASLSCVGAALDDAFPAADHQPPRRPRVLRQIDVLRRVQDVRRHLDEVVNTLLTDADLALTAAEDAHNLAGDLADFIAGTGEYATHQRGEDRMSDTAVTVTLPANAAKRAVQCLGYGQYPTDDQREARARIKQALLDSGHPVDSDKPATR